MQIYSAEFEDNENEQNTLERNISDEIERWGKLF